MIKLPDGDQINLRTTLGQIVAIGKMLRACKGFMHHSAQEDMEDAIDYLDLVELHFELAIEAYEKQVGTNEH
jgi:hypothetical protein